MRLLSIHTTCVNCFITASNLELRKATQWIPMPFWKKQRYALLDWTAGIFWHTTLSKAFGCRAQVSSHVKAMLELIFPLYAYLHLNYPSITASCSIVHKQSSASKFLSQFLFIVLHMNRFLLSLCFRSCGLSLYQWGQFCCVVVVSLFYSFCSNYRGSVGFLFQ